MTFERAPACRGGIVALTVLIAALLSSAWAAPVSVEIPAQLSAWPGTSQPEFTLDDLALTRISLSGHRAAVVVVHFFATWCEPCRDELPALNRLVARSDPAKLRVVTISVAEVDVRVRNFVEKLPVNFPVLLDRDRSVAKAWNVSALPTTFLLDRTLKPRLFVERDYDWDRLDIGEVLKSFGS